MIQNAVLMQYFEWYTPSGILWRQLAEEAARLAGLGICALWIPPAYKGAEGAADVGYAVYDLYDLGEFDQKGGVPTRYGTKAELLAAIEEAHRQGLAVYADIVLDHKIGADGSEWVSAAEYNPDNRLEQESGLRKIKAATRFSFPGRAGKHSDFVWHWRHFTGIDRDESAKREGVFKFAGKCWAKNVDRENGNYDYLMGASLDLNNPEVCEELKRWGIWFAATTKVDGFRLDAIKHMKFSFHSEWLHALRSHFQREFFTVGEYWSKHLSALQHFLESTEDALSLFDVPLHFRLYWASISGGRFDLRTIFEDTLTLADPVKAVTFVDNHDSQPGQALESWVRDWFKPQAYALILLREAGYPCVFYGDYYGIGHDGIAPKKEMLEALLRVRRQYAYGRQRDYFDQPRTIGWTRSGDERHPHSGLAVLVDNGAGGGKRMKVGTAQAGRTFVDLTGQRPEKVLISGDGQGEFTVEPFSLSVWIREEALRELPGKAPDPKAWVFPRPSPREDVAELRKAGEETREHGDDKNADFLLGLAEQRGGS